MVGTFVQPKRAYLCAEYRTRSEQLRIGKVGEKWGRGGGGGVGENAHELEKNAKILEKINTIIGK